MKYQQIGNILIFNKINKKEAKKFLKKFPYIKTICVRTGKIKSQFRQPQLKVLISRVKSKKTETIHHESGIFYKFDVKKIMFAKGNINERHRIAKIAKKSEIIVDMFAGIGYFSLPLAKCTETKVYAIELNPRAYYYLLENIKLNKLKNIKAIKGNCSKIVPKLAKQVKADRILMGLLPSPYRYLNAAFQIAKKKTKIYYSCLIEKKNKKRRINNLIKKINLIASKYKLKIKLLRAVKVKSYSPAFDHYVLDLQIKL